MLKGAAKSSPRSIKFNSDSDSDSDSRSSEADASNSNQKGSLLGKATTKNGDDDDDDLFVVRREARDELPPEALVTVPVAPLTHRRILREKKKALSAMPISTRIVFDDETEEPTIHSSVFDEKVLPSHEELTGKAVDYQAQQFKEMRDRDVADKEAQKQRRREKRIKQKNKLKQENGLSSSSGAVLFETDDANNDKKDENSDFEAYNSEYDDNEDFQQNLDFDEELASQLLS